MKSLLYLSFLKTKAQLRYYFRKVSSALLSLFFILVYGGIFLMLFINCNHQPMEITSELNLTIAIVIGFLALMLLTTLLASKKALFQGEDAYFLFSGPFLKKQVLAYLTLKTFMQAAMIEFFVLYMFASFSMTLSYNWGFLGVLILGVYFVIVAFLMLTDYLYLLSIGDVKYKKVPYFIFGLFALLVMGILGTIYLETGNIQTLLPHFINSPLFYTIPFFGWLKLALISYVEGKVMLCLLGLGLLVAGTMCCFLLLTRYKGDFYEQALADGLDYSQRMKAARKGNAVMDVKIKKQVEGSFKDGAYAILSKNILELKKTKQWLTLNDFIILGLYMVITIISDLGMGFFIYLLIMYIFTALQQSSYYKELQNYHIYLIPDKPLKKLMAIILPTFIKVCVTSCLALFIVGLYYQISILDIFHYCLVMLGYICVFISSTLLTLRILKSRTSQVFENLFRMLIMLVCSIPSIVLMVFVYFSGMTGPFVMFLISYSSLIMNFVVSVGILYFCKDMMNGRELKSE